ncbi:MAG TPA: hypothetical protein VI731_07150 [Bacteroidia bacterium]|nr:hypothetical protein [Bacteroidia bacterium]
MSAQAETVIINENATIGEAVEVKLRLRYTEGTEAARIIWPELNDSLTGGVEILRVDTILTSLVNRASVLYEQSRSVFIIAFDSGSYTIPSIKYVVNEDTVRSMPVVLNVNTIPVDTTKPIRDIKGIYDVPPAPPAVSADDPFQPWVWLAAAASLLLLIAFLVWYRKRGPKAVPETPGRILLPHEIYLQQLAELGMKKSWLTGDLKGYYVALTGIMRSWLVERYGFHALEMTTHEILRVLHLENVRTGSIENITEVLHSADMVKFAKAIPPAPDCERHLQLSIDFVQSTFIAPLIPMEKEELT